MRVNCRLVVSKVLTLVTFLILITTEPSPANGLQCYVCGGYLVHQFYTEKVSEASKLDPILQEPIAQAKERMVNSEKMWTAMSKLCELGSEVVNCSKVGFLLKDGEKLACVEVEKPKDGRVGRTCLPMTRGEELWSWSKGDAYGRACEEDFCNIQYPLPLPPTFHLSYSKDTFWMSFLFTVIAMVCFILLFLLIIGCCVVSCFIRGARDFSRGPL